MKERNVILTQVHNSSMKESINLSVKSTTEAMRTLQNELTKLEEEMEEIENDLLFDIERPSKRYLRMKAMYLKISRDFEELTK